jgi:hypothetical protein
MSTLCSDLSEVPRTFTLCHFFDVKVSELPFYLLHKLYFFGGKEMKENLNRIAECFVLEWLNATPNLLVGISSQLLT